MQSELPLTPYIPALETPKALLDHLRGCSQSVDRGWGLIRGSPREGSTSGSHDYWKNLLPYRLSERGPQFAAAAAGISLCSLLCSSSQAAHNFEQLASSKPGRERAPCKIDIIMGILMTSFQ